MPAYAGAASAGSLGVGTRARRLRAARQSVASASVAYDRELAERIRALLPEGVAVSEQAMFGGLAFLVAGNMAIAASGQGGVLVRVDPAEAEQLMAETTAEPMEMRGRSMRGWLRVTADDVRTKRQLSKWVRLGVAYAASLPRKGTTR